MKTSNNSWELDFSNINTYALSNIEQVLQIYLPGGKYNGREYLVLNPTRHDNHIGSFSINVNTCAWADFATKDSGGDCISLIAYVKCLSQYEAAKELAIQFGITHSTYVKPLQKTEQKDNVLNAKDHPMPTSHSKFGAIKYYWTYRDADGAPLFYICRFDLQTGKTYLPLTLWAIGGDKRSWKWKGYTQPYPLYNLNLLILHPKATVVVCEGEKSADAAARLFTMPNYVTTTFAHGANAIKKTDWKPLHGRDVILWPDHDHAGQQCMSSLFKLLGGNNAIKRNYNSKLD